MQIIVKVNKKYQTKVSIMQIQAIVAISDALFHWCKIITVTSYSNFLLDLVQQKYISIPNAVNVEQNPHTKAITQISVNSICKYIFI